jgi:hypothetical protein
MMIDHIVSENPQKGAHRPSEDFRFSEKKSYVDQRQLSLITSRFYVFFRK